MQWIQRAMFALGWMPRWLRRWLGRLIGTLVFWLSLKPRRQTEFNLALAYPDLSQHARRHLTQASLCDLGQKLFDLPATWTSSVDRLRALVGPVDGYPEFLKARSQGPTLILLPHLGNWELFGVWLANDLPYTAMFRPLRLEALSELVKSARERGGNTLVTADRSGVRALVCALRSGHTAIVLPDQTPKRGTGVYVPFFGVETLTATLPYRLAQSTGAPVYVAAAVQAGPQYRIVFRALPPAHTMDEVAWLSAMNEEIEALVKQFPEQYQWEYARFRDAPDGTLRVP